MTCPGNTVFTHDHACRLRQQRPPSRRFFPPALPEGVYRSDLPGNLPGHAERKPADLARVAKGLAHPGRLPHAAMTGKDRSRTGTAWDPPLDHRLLRSGLHTRTAALPSAATASEALPPARSAYRWPTPPRSAALTIAATWHEILKFPSAFSRHAPPETISGGQGS